MCGIAGYFGSRSLDKKLISSTIGLMKNRGPDNSGYLIEDLGEGYTLCLLHSRLSIVGLGEQSNQPYRRGKNALSYNGEIYNYLEIRNRLVQKGIRFITNSDTEVLFSQLCAHGLEGISDCEGMWAFAWFDFSSQKLTLCRDRFGEKPLYVYEDGSGVFFASEPKYIFSLLGRKLSINNHQVSRFLVQGYKSLYKKSQTFFIDLKELSPGVIYQYSRSSLVTYRYWSAFSSNEKVDMSYQDAVEEVRVLLYNALRIRLRSDVPVAFCLSGGVDSNALASIAKHVYDFSVNSFTIQNTDSRYDESQMVLSAVGHLKSNHVNIPISSSGFLDKLRKLVLCHDAPVYTISLFLQSTLYEVISRMGYKVSMSGIGADEIFSGYYDHHLAYLSVVRSQDDQLYKLALESWRKNVAPYVRNPYLSNPEYMTDRPDARSHIFLNSHLYARLLRSPFEESFEEVTYHQDLLRNRMLNETFHETLPPLLHDEDRNAMYYSVENRSPFLDSTLYEFVQRIPTIHLIRNGLAKAVLRDAVKPIVPSSIARCPKKVGFNAPITDFISLHSSDTLDFLLEDSPIYDLVCRDSFREFLHSVATPTISNSDSKFIFSFISAKLFMQHFV